MIRARNMYDMLERMYIRYNAMKWLKAPEDWSSYYAYCRAYNEFMRSAHESSQSQTKHVRRLCKTTGLGINLPRCTKQLVGPLTTM
jgi:hypothetical protein